MPKRLVKGIKLRQNSLGLQLLFITQPNSYNKGEFVRAKKNKVEA